MPSWPGVFQVGIFFSDAPVLIVMYFQLWAFFKSLKVFSHVAYRFRFSVTISPFPILCSKFVLRSSNPVVRMSSHIPPYLQVKFSFIIMECSILSWFDRSYVSIFLIFILLSIPSTLSLWVISFVHLVFAFLCSSQYIVAFFFCFSIFGCFRKSFICVWFPI